jgi:nucleoside-diphosphate kinase
LRRTLAKRIVGKIIQRIEDEGFTIGRLRLAHLTLDEAKGFYIVHKEKKFYGSLTDPDVPAKPLSLLREAWKQARAEWRDWP